MERAEATGSKKRQEREEQKLFSRLAFRQHRALGRLKKEIFQPDFVVFFLGVLGDLACLARSSSFA
jgi:hypothetical protein